MDVKRHVYDLCINYDDRLLGLVEAQLEMGDVELDQSCVRLYGVGRVRGDEDMVCQLFRYIRHCQMDGRRQTYRQTNKQTAQVDNT